MTDTKTATVEVLTAEVRVLMVGSRQITLSVFRQLDIVPYDSCIPMGRVNDSKDQERWIVGKNSNGNLVRGQFTYGRWSQKEFEERESTYRALPLIVLAGLK